MSDVQDYLLKVDNDEVAAAAIAKTSAYSELIFLIKEKNPSLPAL